MERVELGQLVLVACTVALGGEARRGKREEKEGRGKEKVLLFYKGSNN
jgi:hypothetical protein